MNRLSEIKGPALKSRAVEIKEYCSRELEFINTQGLFRFYNRHGPSHSQKVWENIKKILERKNVVLSEYELFLAEAAAWCHDLGMIKEIGENFDEPKVCEEVRNTHHERILKYIPEHWEALSLGNEPEALLLANICWAHSSKADLSKLKEKDEILVGENVGKVRTRFLGALLRLADALDAGKDRLPPENYRDHPEIPVSTHKEYWKHEVVDSVKTKDGHIILQMSVKYEYPVDVVEKVKKKLNDEIESVKGVLGEYGVDLKFDFLVIESAVKAKRSQEKLEASSNEPKKLSSDKMEFSEMRKEVRQLIETYEIDLRKFIKVTLHEKFGENWWEKRIPSKIRDDVNEEKTRKQRNISPFLSSSLPEDDIAYTTLDQLKGIILTNKKEQMNWAGVYEDYFKDKNDTQSRLDGIREIRNLIDHSNPVSKDDLIGCAVQIRKFIRIISKVVECETDISKEIISEPKEPPKRKTPSQPVISKIDYDKSALREVSSPSELYAVAKNTNFLENSEGDFKSKKKDVFYFGDKSEVDKRIQNILDELGPQRILFITGPPATGKSTFLLFLLDECFRKPLKDICHWQTIFFLNPREEMKKSLERIDEIIKLKYKDRISPEDILLVIDALHRKEEREVGQFSELFNKIRKDGYCLITTIRDSELKNLIDKMGDLKEKFGVEWEKEDLKLEQERMQRIFVNWLIYHNEKSKIELEDIDLSFEEIKNYFLEGEVVPPEKIESYQKFGECARIASRKSKGLAGYIKYLVEDISKGGKFSKEIIEEYPEGMTKLILRIIERDYFIKDDKVLPSLILLLAKQKEPITLEFINSFVEWGVYTIDKSSFDNLDSLKKDILEKANNLTGSSYTSTTSKDNIKLYKLISHWRDAIEDLEHNDGWMNEFKKANRMLKGRIADYLLHIKEKLEKENLERDEIPPSEWPAVADAAKLSYEKGDNELLEHATNFFGGISKMYRDVEQYIFLQNTLSLLWTENSSKAHESKDYDLAVEAIENAIKVNSEDASHHSLAGNFYREKGDLSGALEHYYRATEIEQNNITYLWQLGEGLEDFGGILDEEGNYPEAISKFGDAIKEAYKSAIDIIDKLSEAEKGTKKKQKSQYYWGIGRCNRRMELIRRKLQYVDKGDLKEKAKQYLHEGVGYERGENYDAALEKIKNAKELMLEYIDIVDEFNDGVLKLVSESYKHIGICYEKKGEYENSSDNYIIFSVLNEYAPDSLERFVKNGNKFIGWAKRYTKMRDSFKAIKMYGKSLYCFRKALEASPDDYGVLSELADVSAKIGIFDDAVKYAEKALEEQKLMIKDFQAESDSQILEPYENRLKIRDDIGNKLISICNIVNFAINDEGPWWLSEALYEAGMSLGEFNPKNIVDPWKKNNRREIEKIRDEIRNIKISCLCRAVILNRKNYKAKKELERLVGSLFSIDVLKLDDDLNKGIIPEKLKSIFDANKFSLSENAVVTKEKEDEWLITDKKKFIIRKENRRMNICRSFEEIRNEYGNYYTRDLRRTIENPMDAFRRIHSTAISTLIRLNEARRGGIKGKIKSVMSIYSGYWGWIGGRINMIYKEEKYENKISPEVAEKCFELSLKLRKRNKKSSNSYGWALFNAGKLDAKKLDKAIKAFDYDLKEINRNNPASITGIGMIYMEKGDYEKATRYIKDGVKPNFGIFESHSYEKEPLEVVKYLLKSIIDLKNLASRYDTRDDQLRLLREALEVYKMIGAITREVKLEDVQLREVKLIEDNQNLFKLEAANLEKYISNVEMGY